MATILTFTLTFSTFAGDIHCGVVSESPSQQTSVAGDMATGATVTVDPITGLALDILQNLLSLF
jgi:hypothetical protein